MAMLKVETEFPVERDMARVKNHRSELRKKLQRNTTQAVLLRQKLNEMERDALIIEAEIDRDEALLREYWQNYQESCGRRGAPTMRPAIRMEML